MTLHELVVSSVCINLHSSLHIQCVCVCVCVYICVRLCVYMYVYVRLYDGTADSNLDHARLMLRKSREKNIYFALLLHAIRKLSRGLER